METSYLSPIMMWTGWFWNIAKLNLANEIPNPAAHWWRHKGYGLTKSTHNFTANMYEHEIVP